MSRIVGLVYRIWSIFYYKKALTHHNRSLALAKQKPSTENILLDYLNLFMSPNLIDVNIQTFRVYAHLPYSIRQGDNVAIPIFVFNFSPKELAVEVVLQPNMQEFVLIGSSLKKTVTIPAGSNVTVHFNIHANCLGDVAIKIIGTSRGYSDVIYKRLVVQPEGVTIYKQHDIFYALKGDDEKRRNTLKLKIPDVIVPDSVHIKVSCVGDVVDATIRNMKKFLQIPCGCGVQNIVQFVQNYKVLDYLTSTHHLAPDLEKTALAHLQIGYQRQLSYKYDKGSYSAYGKSDPNGSTWLTAYVMWSFQQASKYIDIDAADMADGIEFLQSQQEPNGSFIEHSTLFDFTNVNEFGLSAFVLLVLTEHMKTKASKQDWSYIDKGLQYLRQNMNQCRSAEVDAIATYVLRLREPTEATGATPLKVPTINWQCNNQAGHGIASDSLEALIGFAKKIQYTSSDALEITISDASTGRQCGKFRINRNNKKECQWLTIPKGARILRYAVKGQGFGVLHIDYRYNIAPHTKHPSFQLLN